MATKFRPTTALGTLQLASEAAQTGEGPRRIGMGNLTENLPMVGKVAVICSENGLEAQLEAQFEAQLPTLRRGWLPDMDLNHDKQIQSLLCYRYTIGQSIGRPR